MKKKDILLIILRCLLALTLFIVAIVNYDTLSNLDVVELLSFTDSLIIMTAVILAVYFVKALVFVIPASVVYVAVGAVINPAIAVLINLAGIFIEVSVTWLLGRFLGKDAVYNLLSKKETGRKLLQKNLGGNIKVLLAIRAFPGFPIDFVSLFYGASGCSYLKYAVFSTVGISWRVILFTILGDALFKWIPMDKIILAVICCIPAGIVYYIVSTVKKAKKSEKQEGENEI